jgi:hypothetical protein
MDPAPFLCPRHANDQLQLSIITTAAAVQQVSPIVLPAAISSGFADGGGE